MKQVYTAEQKEIVRRLLQTEMHMPEEEADADLIDACLLVLTEDAEIPPVSAVLDTDAIEDRARRAEQGRKYKRKNVGRVILIAAICSILAVTAGFSLFGVANSVNLDMDNPAIQADADSVSIDLLQLDSHAVIYDDPEIYPLANAVRRNGEANTVLPKELYAYAAQDEYATSVAASVYENGHAYVCTSADNDDYAFFAEVWRADALGWSGTMKFFYVYAAEQYRINGMDVFVVRYQARKNGPILCSILYVDDELAYTIQMYGEFANYDVAKRIAKSLAPEAT